MRSEHSSMHLHSDDEARNIYLALRSRLRHRVMVHGPSPEAERALPGPAQPHPMAMLTQRAVPPSD